ncbi:MAG: hypothetical protein ABI134_12360, partial [Byssovorax sp.]
LLLIEAHLTRPSLDSLRLRVGTLHQMIDGEEWLEAALSWINSNQSPIAAVQIGPINRLTVYEHSDTLKKAISLLTAILAQRGLIVVIYGKNIKQIIRAGIVGEEWKVSPGANAPAERLKVERTVFGGERIKYEFEMS